MVAQPIPREAKHTEYHPCPLCGGYERLDRGRGIRCAGWTEGEYVYCQRPQLAGRAPYSPRADVYRHRLSGNCLCGVMHGPSRNPERPVRLPPPLTPPNREKRAPTPLGQPSEVYDYQGEAGELRMQVLAFRKPDGSKTFRQRRPNGRGGWEWNLEGVDLVPYRLPELLASAGAGPVYVVEGEKDADRLWALGLRATTNPMGAGKWRAAFSVHLAGDAVVILPDNDTAGRDHARDVAVSLVATAASVRVLTLPGLPERGDVSDWLNAGGTAEQLTAWAAVWPEWQMPAAAIPVEEPKPEAGRLAQIVSLAKNPATRGDLANHVFTYDWLRRREAVGLSNEQPVRVSATFKAKEAGCTAPTFRLHLQTMAAAGVLTWQKRVMKPQDLRPDGTRYGRLETQTFITVPGGAEGYLQRVSQLTAEAQLHGRRRLKPLVLPACASCGSADVDAVCRECGDCQDTAAPDAVVDVLFEGGDCEIRQEKDFYSLNTVEELTLSTVGIPTPSGSAAKEAPEPAPEWEHSQSGEIPHRPDQTALRPDRALSHSEIANEKNDGGQGRTAGCGGPAARSDGLGTERGRVAAGGGGTGGGNGLDGLPHPRQPAVRSGLAGPCAGETGPPADLARTEAAGRIPDQRTVPLAGAAGAGAGDSSAAGAAFGLAGRGSDAEGAG